MSIASQLATDLKQVYFGGNWTAVNLKDTLAAVNYEQATHKVKDLNTIAALVFHIDYYVAAVIKVLEGGPLDAHDKFSFDLPPIRSQQDWQALVSKVLANAEIFASLVEKLDEETMSRDLADPKYGSYYRNLLGIIEHSHYHLGQIAILKKLQQPA